MHLKDILKKKQKIESGTPGEDSSHSGPQITLNRPDSETEEVLDQQRSTVRRVQPSSGDGAAAVETEWTGARRRSPSAASSQSKSTSWQSESDAEGSKPPSRHGEKRLSALFRPRRSPSRDQSPSLPDDLEYIEDQGLPEDNEARWEKRATLLAQRSSTSLELPSGLAAPGERPGMRPRSISDAKSDDDIQKAISLHEAGDLEKSTAMFGRLADPQGANNALSQVLYGLALRHGWGIPPNPSNAVSYLSLAARNSAAIESVALDAGLKKGGAAKGELVLAIYELANCYRMGLGVARDPVAARRYFETAARLGDLDAMEQTARCYEEGIGGKKNKFAAARYYRLAEQGGHNIVGNSWIWKPKYDPKPTPAI